MLIGRGAELESVARLLEAATGGHGQVLVVQGEAGIGKSALLAVAGQAAEASDVVLLTGAGDELGAARPFAPLLDAVATGPGGEAVRAALQRQLGPERERPAAPLETGPGARSIVIDELIAHLEDLCTAGPVALFIDDLHWADAATVAALASLVRHADDLPLVVVLAFRPTPRRRELDALLDRLAAIDAAGGRPPVTTLDLVRLSGEDVDRLATTVVGAAPGPGLRSFLDRCAGNPLLVVELLASLRQAELLAPNGGAVDTVAGSMADDAVVATLPDTFAGTIRRRMFDLDEDQRTVATMAALLGSRFGVGDLAAVTRRRATDLFPVVQALVEARLLVDDGTTLRYRHDLVRDAVVSTLPASVRRELHREVAEALEASGAPLARVAEHVALGAQRGSAAAVATLRAAAHEIIGHDPAGAVGLLRRALELVRPTDPGRDLLVAQLVDALAWSGGLDEAQATAEEVLARPVDPDAEIGLRSAVSRSLLILGRPAEAITHEELLVDLHRSLGRSTAWTLAESAVCRLFALDLDGALREAAAAVEEAALPADADGGTADAEATRQSAAILGLSVQAFGWVTLGDSAKATELATRAVRMADATPDGEGHRMHPNLFLGIALQSHGRPDDAGIALGRGRTFGEALGASWALPIYHFLAALGHWDTGTWDDLLAEVDAGITFGEERVSSIGQVWAFGVAGRVHVHRNELDRAAQLLDAGDRVVEDQGVQYGLDWLALGRALWLEASGRADEGFALLRQVWDGAVGLQASASLVTIGGDLAHLAVASGADHVAEAVADELATLAQRSPQDLVVRARERRARDLARREPALLLEAVEHFSGVRHRFEVAVVRTEAAELLLSAGDDDGGGALLDEALTTFDAVGAPREASRARALLARHRPGQRRARPPRPVVGWDALTTTEQEVVEEVCAGRSNGQVATRLGISRRTVEAHLRSIYRKVGVSTRLALAVALHERTATAEV